MKNKSGNIKVTHIPLAHKIANPDDYYSCGQQSIYRKTQKEMDAIMKKIEKLK